MQLRRVLLLFALVLGMSALVAQIAPPPDDDRREERTTPVEPASPPRAAGADTPRELRLSAPRTGGEVPVERIAEGARVELVVRATEPGDVELERLGLRQTAVPGAPARFELLTGPAGVHDVVFHPLRRDPQVIARLVVAETARVTRPARRP